MKKIWLIATGIVCAIPVAGTLTAFASTGTGYDSSADTTVSVNLPVSLQGPSTGTVLYSTQESLYSTTGASVPHDYVWVNVNGTPILAVDPPKPMY